MQPKRIYPAYFLILSLAFYTVFFILPSAIGLAMSFTNWNSMGTNLRFVGLDHFVQIFTTQRYLKVIANTILFALITTALKNVLGFSLALTLNAKFRTRNGLRTVFFLPVMLAPLVLGLIFTSVYSRDNGVLNQFLRSVGLDSLAMDWLGSMATALGAVMFVEVWRLFGQNMVIYIAGLQAISEDTLEAADIDGAGYWKKLRHIIIPQMMPSITINLILNLIAGLKVFDLVFVLTNGGPAGATEVLNTSVFKEYSSGRYGFSTALGLVMFVFTCAVAFSVLRGMNKAAKEEA